MRIPTTPDQPAQINIVPMIDVIFAILTFFIMSTLFLNQTEGLPVNLPKASTAKPQAQTKLVVTVDPQGQVSVNKKAAPLETLKSQIQALMPDNQTAIVIINADEKVNHGQVVQVMDQVRQIEGAKLAIATRR